MGQFRTDISKGCPLDQLMSEVKVLTWEDRHSLLDMVAIKESLVAIPPEETLADLFIITRRHGLYMREMYIKT